MKAYRNGECVSLKEHLEYHIERLTVSVGQQLHKAIQARVPHLSNVGGTTANGLDCGSHKVFIHAFNVCLPEKKILAKSSNTRRRLLSRLGESLLAEESDFQLWLKTIPKVQFNRTWNSLRMVEMFVSLARLVRTSSCKTQKGNHHFEDCKLNLQDSTV